MNIKIKKSYKVAPEKLLKNKYPELILLWDYEKNLFPNVDLDTVSYGSTENVNWLCESGNREHDYNIKISNRTKINKDGNLRGCKKCFQDSRCFQNKKLVEEHIKQYTQTYFSVEIGDETELYVENLLKAMNCYEKVTGLGSLGGNADISITIDNKVYYSQVKTLIHERKDVYRAYDVDGYPDDMLIIMVNKERTRFALEFAGNITQTDLSLSFSSTTSKFKHIMYTDLDLFKHKLKEMMIHSAMENKFSDNILK